MDKEVKLKALWRKILMLQGSTIQPSDNFFSCGGDSLAALRLVHAAAHSGVQISLAAIFQSPRMRDQALQSTFIPPSLFPSSPAPFSLINSLIEQGVLLEEVAQLCNTVHNNIEDAYPCLPSQEAIIRKTFHPDSPLLGRKRLPLPPSIDKSRFLNAWGHVAMIHRPLRTRIVKIASGEILQVILRDSILESQDAESEPMGFGTALCRWSLVEGRGIGDDCFLVVCHPAICDSWTFPILGAQVFRAYHGMQIESFLEPHVLLTQIGSRPSPEFQSFWERQLAGADQTSIFPSLPSSVGGVRVKSVITSSISLSEKDSLDISLPSLVYAAWSLLASQMSGVDDVTFGATTTGRHVPIPGIEHMLSSTVATMPMRLRINRQNPVFDYVVMVQNHLLDIMQFKNFSLDDICSISDETRSACRFETLIIMQSPPNEQHTLPNNKPMNEQKLWTEIQNLDANETLTNLNDCALVILINQAKDGLAIEVRYDTQVQSAAQVRLLVDQFAFVLKQVGFHGNGEVALGELNYVSDSDVDRIWSLNCANVEAVDECIHVAIANINLAHSHAQAVCAWDGTLSYEELDQLSARFARVSMRHGIGKGSFVPLCLEKSMWCVVAMLGIMRAGAAFVPLSARNNPKQRLRTIISQVQAEYVVCSTATMISASDIAPNVINVHDVFAGPENTSDSKLVLPHCSPGDTAFVIFTSGTTGCPKGILTTHASFNTGAKYLQEPLAIHRDSRVYDFAPYSFDIAVHNNLITLILGACVCIPSENDLLNDLEGSFERLRANWVDMPPSVARLMNPAAVPSLKTIVLAGEAVGRDLVLQWGPYARVINAYGPAECLICTVHVDIKEPEKAAIIGRPVGCSVWIVDADGENLVPFGAPGQLAVEGPIVSPGYVNMPSETQAAQRQNPSFLSRGSSAYPGRNGRIHCTGDLARYNADGSILYLGRATAQVKINGQRVELAEVEFHIRQSSVRALRDIAAELVSFPGNLKRLCAFLVFDEHSPKKESEVLDLVPQSLAAKFIEPEEDLLTSLKERVPSYMVPSAFVQLSHIPLGHTNKVDREELKRCASKLARDDLHSKPKERVTARPRRAALREPSTTDEVQMQRLWADALGLSPRQVGADDNFFLEHNGDSLDAMRLAAVARRQGLDLRVSDVFSSPKLSELASTMASRAPQTRGSALEEIPAFQLLQSSADADGVRFEAAKKCDVDARNVVDAFPCTPLQENMLASTIKDPASFVSVRFYRVPNSVNLHKLREAWSAVCSHNPIFRTRLVQLRNCRLSQVVISEDAEWKEYHTVEECMRSMQERKMGLGSRLTKWAVVLLPNEIRLVWAIHHALFDGWMLPMINDQLELCYHSKITLLPAYLDMKPFLKYTLGENRVASKTFWAHELNGAESCTIFPVLPEKYYEPQPDSILAKVLHVRTDSSITGTNLSVLVYTAWSVLMARLTGSNDIVFGATLTGRNAPVDDIERLMGPTITTVPVRARFDDSQNVGDVIDTLRDKAVKIMPHEHLGIQEIRQLDASCAAACQFQTVLIIQPQTQQQNSSNESLLIEEPDEMDESPAKHMAALNQHANLLEMIPDIEELTIRASFDSKVVSVQRMQRILAQFERVLVEITKQARSAFAKPFKYLDLISQQDLDCIWQWNRELPPSISNGRVHDTISTLAKRWPCAMALDGWDGQLSYIELDRRANLLAEQLIHDHGVGVGSMVPLLFEKSIWANVSMLAVLKSNATFISIDATYPISRLTAQIDQIDAVRLALCSAQQRDLALRLVKSAVIVDELSTSPASETSMLFATEGKSRTTVTTTRSPEDQAYIVFTSGSTGVPKGVRISHANLASAVHHQATALGFTATTRALDSSSYAFDACIFNTFYTWTQGGCLCVPDETSRVGGLESFMRIHRVNLAQLTPSISRVLEPHKMPDLHCLILTGEAITLGDIEKWAQYVRLVNVYGPTECTIMCSAALNVSAQGQAGHIGRGLGANIWLAQADDLSQLAMVGAAGEILIEGPLIGAGYVGNQANSETLVVDPPWLVNGTDSQPGRHGALFRTGDLARYEEDGSIVYIGRIGAEIKLRGQRVDLAHIEDSIRRRVDPGVEIAVDIVHKSGFSTGKSRQMLLSFISPPDNVALQDFKERLQHLAQHLSIHLDDALPAYLKPEAFVMLQSIPKTSSGKVDHKRLKEIVEQALPDQLTWISPIASGQFKSLPSTPIEKSMAELWEEVLGVDHTTIGRDDNFFRLGGDSVTVMRLTTLAHERGLSVQAKDIFSTPQLANVAAKALPTHSSVVPDDTDTSYQPFSLVSDIPNVSRFIRDYVAPALGVLKDDIVDLLPANGFQVDCMKGEGEGQPLGLQYQYFDVSPEFSWPRLVQAMRAVIKACESLRCRFVSYNGRYHQAVLRQPLVLVEEIPMDAMGSQEDYRSFTHRLCSADVALARSDDVFTKVTLLHAGAGRRRIIVRMSHAQYDGWCFEAIFRGIASAYNSQHLTLESAPAFSRVLHHRQLIAGTSRDYWRSFLRGTQEPTPALILKPFTRTTDEEKDRTQTKPVRTLRTRSIANFTTTNDSTIRPEIVLNAAWALVLAERGYEDIVFGNVSTGRNTGMPGLHDVVGPCVNMLPVRLHVPTSRSSKTKLSPQTLRQLVQSAAQQIDDRYPHEGLDWDDLVENCTSWPRGSMYRSAVHFRNMDYLPQLQFRTDSDITDAVVGWTEVVVTPLWTTIMAFPEHDRLWIWLYANPDEIGDEGASEILEVLASYIEDILAALEQG